MPAGVSLPRYLAFGCAALLSMFIGSQIVHITYQPLSDLDKYIEMELEQMPQERRDTIRSKVRELMAT